MWTRPPVRDERPRRDQQATLREILEILRQTYCGKVGAESCTTPTRSRSSVMDRME